MLQPKIVAEGIHKCIKNAERYFSSAILLKTEDRQTSYLLFIYALEEMGKVLLIVNVLFHSDSEDKLREWKSKFKDHQEKFWFSKDLEDHAKNRLAKQSNKGERKMALKKLNVSYVDFNGTRFDLPDSVQEDQIESMYETCRKRLEYLKGRHSSLAEDERIIQQSYSELKDLSLKELKELAKIRGFVVD